MIFQRAARRRASKIVGQRGEALDQARGRLVMIGGFFILAYMLLAARAVDLSVLRSGVYKDEGVLVAQEVPTTIHRRADIVDRNGVLLATTLKTTSLYADTKLIADPKAAAKNLVKTFPDLAFGEILQDLQSGKRFVWLKRRILPEEQLAVLEIGEPGLAFQEEYQRIYPQGRLVSHLLGYTNIDNQGLGGVELGFNSFLNDSEAPLILTIDHRLQHALRREISQAMDQFNAKAGIGVIMDATNGEVLAGVSLPDFDPHVAGKADKDALFNRLTLGVYELGSVFKIFSTAAFLEMRNVPMSTTFDAREPIKIGRFTINDYHAEDRVLTIPEVFMYSSNIGSALMGQAVGNEGLKGFYKDLGLLDPLDFEIREVARPLVPDPWREVNTLTASYGHGIATTPLQTASAVASIVNGGELVRAKIVKDDVREKAVDARSQKRPELRIVSPETAHRMRQLMRLVVTDGTGRNADVRGYRVGGKTGTAEKIIHGRYQKKKLISSFIGAFPMDAPKYVVFVAIDEPKGNKKSFGYATGGWVGAPAVARVVASMASILGIPAKPVPVDRELGASLKKYVAAKGSQ